MAVVACGWVMFSISRDNSRCCESMNVPFIPGTAPTAVCHHGSYWDYAWGNLDSMYASDSLYYSDEGESLGAEYDVYDEPDPAPDPAVDSDADGDTPLPPDEPGPADPADPADRVAPAAEDSLGAPPG